MPGICIQLTEASPLTTPKQKTENKMQNGGPKSQVYNSISNEYWKIHPYPNCLGNFWLRACQLAKGALSRFKALPYLDTDRERARDREKDRPILCRMLPEADRSVGSYWTSSSYRILDCCFESDASSSIHRCLHKPKLRFR